MNNPQSRQFQIRMGSPWARLLALPFLIVLFLLSLVFLLFAFVVGTVRVLFGGARGRPVQDAGPDAGRVIDAEYEIDDDGSSPPE